MLHTELKTPADCFAYLGMDFSKQPDFSTVPEEDRKYFANHYVTIQVVKALNKTVEDKIWRPDWSKTSEWKYQPLVWIKATEDNPAGSGFSRTGTGYDGTFTVVGSRLLFRTRELSDYALAQFTDLYLEEFLYRD